MSFFKSFPKEKDIEEDFVVIENKILNTIPIITNEYIDDALLKYNYSEFIIRRPENYGLLSLYMTHNCERLNKIMIDIYIYQDNDYVHIIHNKNTYIYDKLFGFLSGPDKNIFSHFRIKPHLELT